MAITFARQAFEERRRVPRVEFQGRVELEIPNRPAHVEASSVNLTEGGICVRVQEVLEVRLPVRLRLFAQPRSRPLECPGRIAWVVQRLDLRDAPPFLYDVGVEFINPSARLRQFASRLGVSVKSSPASGAWKRATPHNLQPITIKGRDYEPRLVQEPSSDNAPWHLIVMVEGVPCFSHRYPSAREAIESWKQFKRQTIRSSIREVSA